jgi:serine phosphatase RsbU (regulator of sigma subunit)
MEEVEKKLPENFRIEKNLRSKLSCFSDWNTLLKSVMKKIIPILFLFFSFTTLRAVSDAAKIDSLKLCLKKTQTDSVFFSVNEQLFWLYSYSNQTTPMFSCADTASRLAEKSHKPLWEAKANHMLGAYYKATEDFPKALAYILKALEGYEQAGDKKGLAGAMVYAGYMEELKKDYRKALAYHLRALQIKTEIGEDLRICYLRAGTTYSLLHQNDTAILMFRKGLKEIQNKKGRGGLLGGFYNNMALAFEELNKPDSALTYYHKALKLNEEKSDSISISGTLINLGDVYKAKGDYKAAIDYTNRGLLIAEKIRHKSWIMNAAQLLAQLYEHEGDFRRSVKFLKQYDDIKDSLFSESNQKEMTDMEARYQGEKKAREIEVQNLKLEKQQRDIEKQSARSTLFLAGFLVVIIILGVFIRGYLLKKKINQELSRKNDEIHTQKEIIEEKSKEISDSINYAKHIQDTILPDPAYLKTLFRESFILFKPRNVVSGDFYWFTKRGNKILIAAADCTGHGVPGAFMSMISVDKLNQAILNMDITRPSEILSFVNMGMKVTLKQDLSDARNRDGMDIGLAMIDPVAMKLDFAGANRPLWIVRQGELLEFAPTKSAIGGTTSNSQLFADTEVVLKPGDLVYLFSDGYADQFGGDKGKKMMTRNFKKLVSTLAEKSMEEQLKVLEDAHQEWRGRFEQVDDILIIGVKI